MMPHQILFLQLMYGMACLTTSRMESKEKWSQIGMLHVFSLGYP